MNGIISSESNYSIAELFSLLKKSPSMSGLNLVDKVTTKSAFKVNSSCPVSFDKRIKNIQKNSIQSCRYRFWDKAIDIGSISCSWL